MNRPSNEGASASSRLGGPMDGVAGAASAVGKRPRGRDWIVDKVSSQRRKYRSGRPHPATSAERAGLPEGRKFHVVSGGGYERVQPGVRMLSGGTRRAVPAAAVRQRTGLI